MRAAEGEGKVLHLRGEEKITSLPVHAFKNTHVEAILKKKKKTKLSFHMNSSSATLLYKTRGKEMMA